MICSPRAPSSALRLSIHSYAPHKYCKVALCTRRVLHFMAMRSGTRAAPFCTCANRNLGTHRSMVRGARGSHARQTRVCLFTADASACLFSDTTGILRIQWLSLGRDRLLQIAQGVARARMFHLQILEAFWETHVFFAAAGLRTTLDCSPAPAVASQLC